MWKSYALSGIILESPMTSKHLVRSRHDLLPSE